MVFLVLGPLMYELLQVGLLEGHWLNIDFFLFLFVFFTYVKIQIKSDNLISNSCFFTFISSLQYFFFCCTFWLFFFWSLELLALMSYPFTIILFFYEKLHSFLFSDLRIPMEIICGYFQIFASCLNRLFIYKQNIINYVWFFWQKSKQFKYLHVCFTFLYKSCKNVLVFTSFFTGKISVICYRLIDLWYAILALFEGSFVKFLTYFDLLKNPRYKNFKKDFDPLDFEEDKDSDDKTKD